MWLVHDTETAHCVVNSMALPVQENARWRTTVAHLCVSSAPGSEHPCIEHPRVERPCIEYPCSEYQRQLDKNGNLE